MAEDWQKGDLALCIHSKSGAYTGKIFTVAAVVYLPFREDMTRKILGLQFNDFADPSDGGGWAAYCFRKIKPHTPDAEDAETIRLLKGVGVKELS